MSEEKENDIHFKRASALMEVLVEILKVGQHYDIDPRTLAINVAKFVEAHPEVLLTTKSIPETEMQ